MNVKPHFAVVSLLGILAVTAPGKADIILMDPGSANSEAQVNCRGIALLPQGAPDTYIGNSGSTYGNLVKGKAAQGPKLMADYIKYFKDTFGTGDSNLGQAQKKHILNRCGLANPPTP